MPCRRIAFLFLLVLSSSFVLAQYRTGLPKPELAENAVREFCRLDFVGTRLAANGWARMKPLTLWQENALWKENPQWKTFHIVSRYEQTNETTGFHSDRIVVRYQVLGRFEMGIGYTPNPGAEEVEFKLKETDNAWHIESTDPDVFEPHVSKAFAIQWLQEKLKNVTDPGDKASIESALKQLQPK